MPAIPWPVGTGANVIGPGSSTAGNLVSWGNDDGTVLADTVVSVDSSGNLDGVGTVNGVKVYRALLTQSGTDAPVATVLENSLGGEVVWTRFSAGVYLGTLAGAFPVGQTCLPSLTLPAYNNDYGIGYMDHSGGSPTDVILLRTNDTGSTADDLLSNTFIQILVYPS